MNKPTYEELEQQRNELAMQVERLLGAANRLSFGLVHDEPEWNPSTATSAAFSELQNVIAETPHDALAALKAQLQNQAIYSFAKELLDIKKQTQHLPRDYVTHVLERVIRQRAKEAGNGCS